MIIGAAIVLIGGQAIFWAVRSSAPRELLFWTGIVLVCTGFALVAADQP